MTDFARTLAYNLFSFRGRIRRSDYWLSGIIVFAGMVIFAASMAATFNVDLADTTDLRASAIQAAAVLLFMWPNLAVSIKRLHDRNQSGWWILLSFLPVIGNVWTIINLGILRGSEGENRYGSEPARQQFTLIQHPRAA